MRVTAADADRICASTEAWRLGCKTRRAKQRRSDGRRTRRAWLERGARRGLAPTSGARRGQAVGSSARRRRQQQRNIACSCTDNTAPDVRLCNVLRSHAAPARSAHRRMRCMLDLNAARSAGVGAVELLLRAWAL
jgi:hypothetical protein